MSAVPLLPSMWPRVIEDVAQGVTNIAAYSICFIVPLVIFISPINPAKAAQDFAAFRLQHFDLHGTRLGAIHAALSCEAQTLGFRLIGRKCLLLRLSEVTIELVKDAASRNSGGIIIILPSGPWNDTTKRHFLHLEREFISEEFGVPIYFVKENSALRDIYSNVRHITQVDQGHSRSYALMNAIWSTGYRFSITAPPSMEFVNHEIFTIEGKLMGSNRDSPIIAIVAHYDSFAPVPVSHSYFIGSQALSFGADSNGSGVVILLELARIFSRLYHSSLTQPNFSLLFLLTGGGKFNYLGSKHWLENNLNDLNGSVVQVICLEGLGKYVHSSGTDGTYFNETLFAHVSRTPKEDSLGYKFIKELQFSNLLHSKNFKDAHQYSSDSLQTNENSVRVVHKKINLNDELLAWEHERFAVHRLASMTLSSSWPDLASASQFRRSALDTLPGAGWSDDGYDIIESDVGVSPHILARNARVIAEALVRLIYDINSTQFGTVDTLLVSQSWITEQTSSGLLDLLLRQPRATQFFGPSVELIPPHEAAPSPSKKSGNQAIFSNNDPFLDSGDVQPNLGFRSPANRLTAYLDNDVASDLLVSLQNYFTTYLSEMRLLRQPVLSFYGSGEQGRSGRPSAAALTSASAGEEVGVPLGSSVVLTSAARAEYNIVLYSSVAPSVLYAYKYDNLIIL
ncbi:unnamed protein product [Protopolystoma xenopodis]|uniref:BOS complex subunit NCLN n=1 Tax=Protopolystoma xenopodis TaxID=117903 RepID=A0A448WNS4_9PLAT|nr:unnamed protein product [Protopolystoma xenopodis]